MTIYKHTQIGYVMLIIHFIALVLLLSINLAVVPELFLSDSLLFYITVGMTILILFIMLSFSTLTVSIEEQYLQIKFGYGIFSKRFLLSDIVSVKQVKNHWYYGWGIRRWWRPTMWIYNVSGFDAVELVMKNGKVYRIGTDVPHELVVAFKMIK